MADKNKILMKTAEVWATASYANRNKVGCVISKNNRILATGYNGTLPGEDNCCETEDGITKETVAHAEQNALMFCARNGIQTDGCDMYITLLPCITCAKLIISAGIKKVFYKEEYRILDGKNLLESFSIEVIKIDSTD
jgi:dCMP deaminase